MYQASEDWNTMKNTSILLNILRDWEKWILDTKYSENDYYFNSKYILPLIRKEIKYIKSDKQYWENSLYELGKIIGGSK
jgi:hypothetical protein